MLLLILSNIFLISPRDSTSIPFDITIVFDPPLEPKSVVVYLDGEELKGEKEPEYFYKIINNLVVGKHSIKVQINGRSKEWRFILTKEKERTPLGIWGNFSLGIQNSYYSDTLYSGEGGPIYGLDVSLTKGNYSLNFSLLRDPDYPSEWYPFFRYSGTSYYFEGGYLYPFFDEITIYSPGGFGITGEIDIGFLTITPIFLYSKNYDTLFFEYPRRYYGGKINLLKNNVYLGITLFKAEDDTSNVTGFPLIDPKQSLVVSPEFKWQISDKFSLRLKGGFSKGNKNMYTDTPINGNIFEGNIIYEYDYNNITFGVRKTSPGYLTLGNPYLYTNRTSAFLNGIYEGGLFCTDFDHLIYNSEGNIGFSLIQTLKIPFTNYFSPLFEYQWVRYPEYESEDFLYGGIGFESIFNDVMIYNIFGTYKNLSLEPGRSSMLSTSLYWYPAGHSIGIGGAIFFEREHIRFDVDLFGYISLGDLGALDIYYHPSIEEGYVRHSLRIVYEYGF